MSREVSGAKLAAQIARAVSSVPGVVRMEPPLNRALAQLARPSKAADAVAIQEVDGTVEASVDVIVSPDSQALEIAQQVRQTIVQTLENNGRVPGKVSVSVLGAAPAPTASAE